MNEPLCPVNEQRPRELYGGLANGSSNEATTKPISNARELRRPVYFAANAPDAPPHAPAHPPAPALPGRVLRPPDSGRAGPVRVHGGPPAGGGAGAAPLVGAVVRVGQGGNRFASVVFMPYTYGMANKKPSPTCRLLNRVFAHTLRASDAQSPAFNAAAFRASCLIERVLAAESASGWAAKRPHQ